MARCGILRRGKGTPVLVGSRNLATERPASDQRRFVQQEQRLVRDERTLSGNFHQMRDERTRHGDRRHRSVGAGIMAAIVMVWRILMIAIVIRLWLIAVSIVVVMAVGMCVGAFVMTVMGGRVNHT